MSHAVLVGAAVALAGALVALVFLPDSEIAPARQVSRLARAAARNLLPVGSASQPGAFTTALDLTSQAGQACLSLNAISTQPGWAESLVQRGWTRRVDRVVGALDALSRVRPDPAVGSVLDDATVRLDSLIGAIEEKGRPTALAALAGAAGGDPALAELLWTTVIGPRQRDLRTRLAQAVETGDLSPAADPGMLVVLLLGPVFHRAL